MHPTLHMSKIADIGGINLFAPLTHKYVIDCMAILSANAWLKYTVCEEKNSFKFPSNMTKISDSSRILCKTASESTRRT